MSTLPQLINDLALILIVAGVTTIIFKRLKQPLVLGYILAGFLAGPHMPYTPSIEEGETIKVWSEIGVIFLMFSLGLEFSFKKILKSGLSPIVAASFIMLMMWMMGFGAGHLLHWSTTDCTFVGGMLAMSSTTIIYKAFDDLGLMARRFANRVLGVLILEDILGIVVMVMLSAMAVSNKLEGSEMLWSLGKLGFFLMLWFLVGMWFIPTFFHNNRSFINKETLIVVSIGLCFMMVVVADNVGYSSALGAFMMGSILAETTEAERIDSSISSIKDLFGAIFFVSVGMMVSPSDLLAHWWPIVLLVLAIIFGQAVFGTLGYLLSGSTLKDALMSGFSMMQIGEFAFIIAALGESLGVTDAFLTPIVVAVSIITTFLTPYMIKLAFRITGGSEAKTDKKKVKSEKLVSGNRKNKVALMQPLAAWRRLLRTLALQTLIYGILCVAVVSLLFVSFLLLCRQVFGHWWGNAVCGVIVLAVMAPFLRPIVMRSNGSDDAKYIRQLGTAHRLLFYLTVLVRFALAVSVVFYIINYLSPYKWYLHVVVAVVLVLIIVRLRWIRRLSIYMEERFLTNLSRREEARQESGPQYARQLKGRDLHIARLTLPEDSAWGGKTLSQLRIGGRNGVHVVAILRNHHRLNIPGGSAMLFPGDVIEVVGDDEAVESLMERMRSETCDICVHDGEVMQLQRIVVGESAPLKGVFIKNSGIRDQYRCMVVGFEDAEGNLHIASADHVIQTGDIMWVAGSHEQLAGLKSQLTS